jgi:hypothetical protein
MIVEEEVRKGVSRNGKKLGLATFGFGCFRYNDSRSEIVVVSADLDSCCGEQLLFFSQKCFLIAVSKVGT